jgi:hypothetical protein
MPLAFVMSAGTLTGTFRQMVERQVDFVVVLAMTLRGW